MWNGAPIEVVDMIRGSPGAIVTLKMGHIACGSEDSGKAHHIQNVGVVSDKEKLHKVLSHNLG